MLHHFSAVLLIGLRDYKTGAWEGGVYSHCTKHRHTDRTPPAKGGTCRRCGARFVDRQIGHEATPDAYVARLVAVFKEVKRVLKPSGTLWLNIGDSFAGSWGNYKGIKEKDLIGIPWLLAFALRADGWWLRSEIIWHKPSPLPESVRDRPTRSHEHLFLLAKSKDYFYDYEAAREPLAPASIRRLGQNIGDQEGSARANGGRKTNGKMKAVRFGGNTTPTRLHSGAEWNPTKRPTNTPDISKRPTDAEKDGKANWRDVWTIAHEGFDGPHYATQPTALTRRCILAGSAPGDLILDPFAGTGTTLKIAIETGRRAVGIELSKEFCNVIEERTTTTIGMF